MNNSIYLQLISLNKTYNNHFLKRYVKLVSFFKERNFKKKKFLHHEHHIVPESFGGLDTVDNLVFITIREHFILHHLLYKAFPKSQMTTAFLIMCHYRGQNFRITSKVYEKLQIENAERNSENNLKRVAEGIHPFSGPELQRKRLEDGTHHFLDKEKARERVKKQIEEGRHNWLKENQIKIECEHCKQEFCLGNYKNWHGDKCKLNPLFKNDKPKIECPHCNQYFSKDKFIQWHGDNCKLNPLFKEEKIECEHCNKEFNKGNYLHWHGDKCKLKLS